MSAVDHQPKVSACVEMVPVILYAWPQYCVQKCTHDMVKKNLVYFMTKTFQKPKKISYTLYKCRSTRTWQQIYITIRLEYWDS
jgi:hypothetical protein